MRKIREDEVVFTLDCEPEDMEVRGNAMASGDDKADKRVEDRIIRRLAAGDQWAWCYVKLTATFTLSDGTEIEGSAGLGGCSYKNEKDFKRGGYYEDMRHEALANLQNEIEAQIKRGELLAELFA